MANRKYKTDIKIKLPQKLIELADVFAQKGQELYIVGGFVRNALLGISGGDIDICASLSASEVYEMIKDSDSFFTVDRDSDLGTIAIHDKHSKQYFEYTALREDSYSEGGSHRPTAVTYVSDMKRDALRRDFTIGALYADAKTGYVYDPLEAIDDLFKGAIKTTTADPMDIIKDDGLRIMRMVRVACELGFYIDPKLYKEAKVHVYYLKDIAVERITEELNKIILSDIKYGSLDKRIKTPAHYRGMMMLYNLGAIEYIMPELLMAQGAAQNKKYHEYDVLNHLFHVYKEVPPILTLRLSGLLHDIGKPESKKLYGTAKGHATFGVDIAHSILKRLRYKKTVIDRVDLLVEKHMYDLKGNVPYEEVLEFLCRLGKEAATELLQLKMADEEGKGRGGMESETLVKWQKALAQIEKGNIPTSINNLKINGNDLKELGIFGKEIGRIKEMLWSHTIRHPEDNNKEMLINLAEKYKNA